MQRVLYSDTQPKVVRFILGFKNTVKSKDNFVPKIVQWDFFNSCIVSQLNGS